MSPIERMRDNLARRFPETKFACLPGQGNEPRATELWASIGEYDQLIATDDTDHGFVIRSRGVTITFDLSDGIPALREAVKILSEEIRAFRSGETLASVRRLFEEPFALCQSCRQSFLDHLKATDKERPR